MVESYVCLLCIFLLCYVCWLFYMLEVKQFKKHFSKTPSHNAPTLDKYRTNFPENPSFEITSVSLEDNTE